MSRMIQTTLLVVIVANSVAANFVAVNSVIGRVNSSAAETCRIRVVDRENGWPVPLIELRTTHHVSFYTDNNGCVAFDLPELMGQPTWLFVEGHGYSVPADGFGYRGVRILPEQNKSITIEVDRTLPAKRLGRITGGGLFAESQKLDDERDWKEQGVLGCDSVQTALHQGKLFWIWGDTTLAHYPLGLFNSTGATTSPRPLEHFSPPIRLRYDYFQDENNAPRNVAEMPGQGPTWLSGMASIKDQAGEQQLVASYAKIKPPLEEYERGLCRWNEETNRFDRQLVHWEKSQESAEPAPVPQGHAVTYIDDKGNEWILFGDPFPSLKCQATFESWSDPKQWQILTPQKSVPAWKSDQTVEPHRGAIAWNEFRKRWVTIFTQWNGESSLLGELWYAEADSPFGPWQDAIKVVTHDKYTFYNPHLHSEFVENGSSVLLFEATFTRTFSKSEYATPRHDYNQVLYRLDLDEIYSQAKEEN